VTALAFQDLVAIRAANSAIYDYHGVW